MRRFIPLLLILLLLPAVAHGQTVGVLDTIVGGFKAGTAGWESPLEGLAVGTFRVLALMQFGWAMATLALRRADFSEVMMVIVQQAFSIGIFYYALTTFSTWGPLIITSFRYAAGVAGGQSTFSPTDVFAIGANIAGQVWDQVTVLTGITHVGQAFAMAIAALVILGAFVVMTCTMILTLVQSYFVTSAGALLLAFGGTAWSREIAMVVVRQCFAIGVKLFALQLVISIGMGFMQAWVLTPASVIDVNMVMVLIGQSLVVAVIAHSVPTMFERMLGGVGMAEGMALISKAARTAEITAAVTAGVVGGFAAVGGAAAASGARLGASVASGAASAPTSAVGRAAYVMRGTASGTAKAAGQAASRSIGARLSGRRQSFGAGLFSEAGAVWGEAAAQRAANAQRARDNQPPAGTP